MRSLDTLQTYYTLYNIFQDKPRFKQKIVSDALGMSGRGKSRTSASNCVLKLYGKKISFRPNLILRPYENCFTTAYFLKARRPQDITNSLITLSRDTRISYLLLLSGMYDFFVTTRYDLHFDENFKVKKKSILYTPIYTHPHGWNLEMKNAFRSVANSTLSKGKIEREMGDFLPWEDIHFRIFDIMKHNVQMPFSEVARGTNLSQITAKKYFYEDVLPYCNIAHYFFPKGYDHYVQSLLLVKSDHEKGLVDSLSKLPCTTYVFPLEKEIALGIFHEGVDDLMFAFKKLEEKGYIKKHLLLVPLYWD